MSKSLYVPHDHDHHQSRLIHWKKKEAVYIHPFSQHNILLDEYGPSGCKPLPIAVCGLHSEWLYIIHQHHIITTSVRQKTGGSMTAEEKILN